MESSLLAFESSVLSCVPYLTRQRTVLKLHSPGGVAGGWWLARGLLSDLVYLTGTRIRFIVLFVPSLVPQGLRSALYRLFCIICRPHLDADDTLVVDRTHFYPGYTTFDVYISITA